MPAKKIKVVEDINKKNEEIFKKLSQQFKKNKNLTDEQIYKLQDLDNMYKGKLTAKAKKNHEYIFLKFMSLPSRNEFTKDEPLKEGKKYISTFDRPMNAIIKRYLDLIYPEQKYKNQIEKMIDKIRLYNLLIKNIEKERNKIKVNIQPPEEKKQIKQEIKQVKKQAPIGAISKYYKDFLKKKKQKDYIESEEEKKTRHIVREYLINYLDTLKQELEVTENEITKFHLKKDIKDFKDVIDDLSDDKKKRKKNKDEDDDD
jgi:hypothetical protein